MVLKKRERCRRPRGLNVAALSGFILLWGASFGQTVGAVTLTASPPVSVKEDNAVIENLLITADGSTKCAIEIYERKNVTIRNVEIRHKNLGICTFKADDLTISNVKLVNTEAPAKGPFCVSGVDFCGDDRTDRSKQISNPDLHIGVKLDKSPNARIERVYTEKASGGFFIHRSPGTQMNDIICNDLRGPRPRGHCVIFVYSDDSSLNGFYAKGYRDQSHQEDSINAFYSNNVTVENGLVDGNFSIHGVGVIADIGSSNMTVRDVDVIDFGTAAVGVWSMDENEVGRNFVAENIRAKDGHCDARYGAAPSSTGLIFTAHPRAENPQFRNIQWYNHCQSQIAYCMPGDSCRKGSGGLADIREEDFTARAPLKLNFPWESGAASATPVITDIVIE